MRILIVSPFFPPKNSIASLRPYSWAKFWSREGHDVTVVTTEKTPTPQDLDLDLSGFRVHSLPWLPRFLQNLPASSTADQTVSNTAGKRRSVVDKMFSLARKSAMRVIAFLQNHYGFFFAQRFPDAYPIWIRLAIGAGRQEQPWDVVVSTYGPYASHVVAYQLKLSGHAKAWVADYRDLWIENPMYPGLWPLNVYEKYLERRMLSTSDLVTTVSDPLAKELQLKFPGVDVHTIANGFDTDDINLLPRDFYFDDHNTIRLVHTGSVYAGFRNPAPLFAAVRNLIMKKDHAAGLNLELLFVGPHSDFVDEQAQIYGVERYVKQVGFLPRQQSLHMQRDSDILMFFDFQDEKAEGILSGKIFEYIFSGTFIWVIGKQYDNAVHDVVTASNTGIHFGDDVDRITEALHALLSTMKKPSVNPNVDILAQYTRKNKAEEMLKAFSSAGLGPIKG